MMTTEKCKQKRQPKCNASNRESHLDATFPAHPRSKTNSRSPRPSDYDRFAIPHVFKHCSTPSAMLTGTAALTLSISAPSMLCPNAA